jgi:hypothetical protein
MENPVTLQEMEDGIVDTGVYSRYCNKIIHFATWIRENEVSWLTEYGMGKIDKLVVSREDEKGLLEWGNLDGVFAALFIVLSWNLVYHGNKTAKIQLSHLK